jgi:hypothetical protein
VAHSWERHGPAPSHHTGPFPLLHRMQPQPVIPAPRKPRVGLVDSQTRVEHLVSSEELLVLQG